MGEVKASGLGSPGGHEKNLGRENFEVHHWDRPQTVTQRGEKERNQDRRREGGRRARKGRYSVIKKRRRAGRKTNAGPGTARGQACV
jgi:hypothetical protein